jgi:hypothetical protein
MHEPTEKTDDAQTQVAAASYEAWYAWAKREFQAEPERLHSAVEAALSALAKGLDSNAAALAAHNRLGIWMVEFAHGRVGIEGGDLVASSAEGTTRVPLASVQTVQARPAGSHTATLIVFAAGEPNPRQFTGCRGPVEVQQLMGELAKAYPSIRTSWIRPTAVTESTPRGKLMQLAGAAITVLGVLLLIGNVTGLFPTMPFAGFITMLLGGAIYGAGGKSQPSSRS